MLLSTTLSFYKKPHIQKELVKFAENKEIAIRYNDFFGKRPDVLMYEQDVLELAKKKATSFHCSEEHWANPLSLRSDIKPKEMQELRTGWDLILDIDCAHFIYSKLAAHLLVLILKEEGITNVTCKFSGNKGFHLAVPWQAFPETFNGAQTKNLFPEAPRKIAAYLKDKLEPALTKAILRVEKNDVEKISKRTGIPFEELVTNNEINIQKFLEIDTILIAPRHLYRMPYSLHEKSGLSSVPVEITKILSFKKTMAEPKNVITSIPFLVRESISKEEALPLLIKAYDYNISHEKLLTTKEEIETKKEYEAPTEAIPEEYFPPCIKNIFLGLQDGKKRATFTLINFLKGAGWSIQMIDQKLHEWNNKNPEPLREVYLKGQISQLKKTKEAIPPHNCPQGGTTYYKDLGVCTPDSFCSKIKNPLQYATLKNLMNTKKKGGRPQLSEEQKEMRRKHREKQKEK
jgi:DNA primase large subunit